MTRLAALRDRQSADDGSADFANPTPLTLVSLFSHV
jgi:hypothetical protein